MTETRKPKEWNQAGEDESTGTTVHSHKLLSHLSCFSVGNVGVLGIASCALVKEFAKVHNAVTQGVLGVGPAFKFALAGLDSISSLLQVSQLFNVDLGRVWDRSVSE